MAVPLPLDKLSCKAAAAAPREPVVLVACGSFNPPTVMHLRMLELAAHEMTRVSSAPARVTAVPLPLLRADPGCERPARSSAA